MVSINFEGAKQFYAKQPDKTAAQAAAEGGFSQEEIALLTGEEGGYVVKFKAIELWEQLRGWLEERSSA